MNAQPGLRLCCRMPLSQVFSSTPPVMSKRIYCNKCVYDKKSEI